MDEIRWLEGQLRRGRLSRRDFVGRAGALRLSLAAAGVLAERARAAEPQRGGMLMVGLGGGSAVDSLDPRSYTDAVAAVAGFSAFNLLTEIDAEGKVQPELAESWEAEADAKTWLIRLRPASPSPTARRSRPRTSSTRSTCIAARTPPRAPRAS